MEVVIRIALLFFFIQFVVVMTIMSVALLLARPEMQLLDGEPGHNGLRRTFAIVTHLPSRALRSAARLLHSMRLRSVQ